MYILGITGGHNATAALLKDGKIVACVSEERFSRFKNHAGFPFKSIEYVLGFEKITMKDVDKIVLTQNAGCDIEALGTGYSFNAFLMGYGEKKWFKRLFSDISYKYPWLTDPIIRLREKLIKIPKQIGEEKRNIAYISRHYKIDADKISYADHHLMHAYSTVSNLPKDKKTLVFTLDGEGLTPNYNSLCATVNIFDGINMERIAETDKSRSLGHLYSICTLYLGMKPDEHEYKVMGLAPYAKEKYVDDLYPIFKDMLWVDGLKFNSKFRMQYADSYLIKKLQYKRFDNIAGAVQRLVEEIVTKWVTNAIKQTGITNIAISGGVGMNVKANQKLSELPEVTNIYCMPSSGDESTAIGCCFYGYLQSGKNDIQPLNNLYLGPEYSDDDIKKALIEFLKEDPVYTIKNCDNIEKEIANLLYKDEIVARFKGRSEWGARALGNRSILSNPLNRDNVRIINEMIKSRDFWMPFTPSILEEDIYKYIQNPKKIKCPFMIITFNSTEKAKEELIAAMHPYDFTIRPQSVSKENQDYHRLINEFKELIGIGAVLNTSFNLHGEPNVLSPKDALYTFKNSGLRYLAIGSYLIKKEHG